MRIRVVVLAIAWLVGAPGWVSAQTTAASITGTVKDPTGGVLPGATVEVESPALIEKTRTAVTDGTGQYRIVELPPGSYLVSFALPGFATVRREGLQLTAGFTATVNAELKVGDVAETITVSGQTPVVDVQNSRVTQVVSRDVVDSIPTSKEFQNIALLVPGMVGNRASDTNVGGQAGQTWGTLAIHGGQTSDMKYFLDGYDLQGATARGTNNFQFMDGNYSEYVIDVAAQSAESELGGVRISMVPKSGGNTFRGSFFADVANKSLAGTNVDDDLRRRGLRDPNNVKTALRVHPTFGGPIRQDRLWFYTTYSYMVNNYYVAGIYDNLTPNSMFYTPDLTRQSVYEFWGHDASARLTWQASARQRLTFYFDENRNCHCTFLLTPNTTPDASQRMVTNTHVFQTTYTAPISNRLLFEGGVMYWPQFSSRLSQAGLTGPRITDIGLNVSYNNANGTVNTEPGFVQRAAISYVTGAHSFKVGFYNASHWWKSTRPNAVYYNYTFVNGTPVSVTYLPGNTTDTADQPFNLGLFAQDQWSVNRLTMNYGVRWDYLNYGYDETPVAPSVNIPTTRTFPALQKAGFKDLSPRVGVAYDLFGTGKTALKASVNRYVGAGIAGLNGAIPALGNDVRSWQDLNGNYVVDADHLNPAANGGELGPRTNGNFALAVTPLRYDPDYNLGFGTRPLSNWEFSGGIQQELLANVSLSAAYFRRVYTTFEVTQNAAISPADFDPYCVTAPNDARLPGGGGYQVCGLYDLKPSAVGKTDRIVTSSSNFGNQKEHWNGVDLSLNARLPRGTLVQGGFSTGKTFSDICEIVSGRPNVSAAPAFSGGTTNTAGGISVGSQRGTVTDPSTSTDFCKVVSPFLTQVKALGSYTLPLDIRLAATWQSTPGRLRIAGVVYSSAQVAASLGRPLSSAQTVTVNVMTPGTAFSDRINQLDMRVSKRFQIGRFRTEAIVDFFNALNQNSVTEENNVYGTNGATWIVPRGVMAARLTKFSVQMDF